MQARTVVEIDVRDDRLTKRVIAAIVVAVVHIRLQCLEQRLMCAWSFIRLRRFTLRLNPARSSTRGKSWVLHTTITMEERTHARPALIGLRTTATAVIATEKAAANVSG
jgi:hypothetical protein